MKLARYIFDLMMLGIRRDVVTFAVILLAYACWPFDLVFDLLGIAP